jgi:hypothetical protein
MKKHRKYLAVIDGEMQPPGLVMTPTLAKKLRETPYSRVATFTPSEGFRVG